MTTSDFKRFLRLFDANIDGYSNIVYGLRKLKGIGKRYGSIIKNKIGCKNNMKYKFYHRIGNLNKNNIEEILSLIVDPKVNLVPTWMLNRRLDFNTADSFHVVSTIYESLIREDHDRLITMKTNRGLRYLRGLKIKGQHTKSNGRKGKSVGVQRKKKK